MKKQAIEENTHDIISPMTWAQIGQRGREDAISIYIEAERMLAGPEGDALRRRAVFELSSDFVQRLICTERLIDIQRQQAAEMEETRRATIQAQRDRFRVDAGSIEGALSFFIETLQWNCKPAVQAIPGGVMQGVPEWTVINSSSGLSAGSHPVRERHLLPSPNDVQGLVRWLHDRTSNDIQRGLGLDLAQMPAVSFLVSSGPDGEENFSKLSARWKLPETLAWITPRYCDLNDKLIVRPFLNSRHYTAKLLPGVAIWSGAGIVLIPASTPEAKWILPPSKLELPEDATSLPTLPAELASLLHDASKVSDVMRERIFKMSLSDK